MHPIQMLMESPAFLSILLGATAFKIKQTSLFLHVFQTVFLAFDLHLPEHLLLNKHNNVVYIAVVLTTN